MLKLYDFPASGNSYIVRLLLAQLGIPYRRVDVDILKGKTLTDPSLAKNHNGRIPLLELEPGLFLAESNAILFYLVNGRALFHDYRNKNEEVL